MSKNKFANGKSIFTYLWQEFFFLCAWAVGRCEDCMVVEGRYGWLFIIIDQAEPSGRKKGFVYLFDSVVCHCSMLTFSVLFALDSFSLSPCFSYSDVKFSVLKISFSILQLQKITKQKRNTHTHSNLIKISVRVCSSRITVAIIIARESNEKYM